MDNLDKCRKVIEDVHRDEKKVKRAKELLDLMKACQELNDRDRQNNNRNFDDNRYRYPPMTRIQAPPTQIRVRTLDSPIPISESLRIVQEMMREFQESRRLRNNDLKPDLKRLQRPSRICLDTIDVKTPLVKGEGVMAKMGKKVSVPDIRISTVIESPEEFADKPNRAKTPEDSKLERSLLKPENQLTKKSTGRDSKPKMKKNTSRKYYDGTRTRREKSVKESAISPEVAMEIQTVLERVPINELIVALKKEKEIRDRRKTEANSRRKSKSKSRNLSSPVTDDAILVEVMKHVEKMDQLEVDKSKPKPPWNVSCKVPPVKSFAKSDVLSPACLRIERKLTTLPSRTPRSRISNPDDRYPKSSGTTTAQSEKKTRVKTRRGKKSRPDTSSSKSRKPRNPDTEDHQTVFGETSTPFYDHRLDLPGRSTSPLPPYISRASTYMPIFNGRVNKYGEIRPLTRRRIPPVMDSSDEEQNSPESIPSDKDFSDEEQKIPGLIPPVMDFSEEEQKTPELIHEGTPGEAKPSAQSDDQNNLVQEIPSPRQNIFSPRNNELPWERPPKNPDPVVPKKSGKSKAKDSKAKVRKDVEEGIQILEGLIGPDKSAITDSIVRKVRKHLAKNHPLQVPPREGFFKRLFSKKNSEEPVSPPAPPAPEEPPTEPNEKTTGCFGRLWKRIRSSRNHRAQPMAADN